MHTSAEGDRFVAAKKWSGFYAIAGLGTGIAMDILPINFWVLRFCGAWTDKDERNVTFRLVKVCYKYAIVMLIFSFTASEVIALLFTHNDVEDVTEGLFLVLTFVALCAKFANFLLRQTELSALLDSFRDEICRSRNFAEDTILEKHRYKAKWCITYFMSLSLTTGLALSIHPVMTPSFYAERLLPFKAYLPYSLMDPAAYAVTYLYQTFCAIYGVLLNVSFDSLVYGLTIHACGQIDLLRHRIEVAFDDFVAKNEVISGDVSRISAAKSIQVFVKHHIHVRDLGLRIQSMFVWLVTILFFFSLITLCTSIFQMSKKKLLSVEFLSLLLYLGSMLAQIFFYCWYGNEFELKSKSIADSVYASNWTKLTTQAQGSLQLIMVRSQKGFCISFYSIFALALPTFMWILKTSYSAFSLLQNMSDEL